MATLFDFSRQRLASLIFGFILVFGVIAVDAVAKKASSSQPSTGAAAQKVDLNTATEKELEDIPGVGKATAEKIIAGRPYTSLDGLSKAGLSKSAITKITPLVTVGAATSSTKSPAAPPAAKNTAPAAPPAAPAAKSPSPITKPAAAPAAKVDLNNATQQQLEDLPGVGAATAKKIIAGRPYASVDDLAKAGVSKSTISKVAPLVMIGAAPSSMKPAATAPAAPKPAAPAAVSTAPAATPAAQPSKPALPAAAPAAKTAPSSSTAYAPPPAAGMVWVNLDTKVYHKEGDRWYGKTKNGKYMTEADAIKAGYRPVKEKEKKQ